MFKIVNSYRGEVTFPKFGGKTCVAENYGYVGKVYDMFVQGF